MRSLKISFIVILIILLCFWGIEILKCEISTYKHGREFKDVYQEDTMIGNIEYLKVLNYTGDTARVYYVSEKHSGGDILEFCKERGKWHCISWNTIWSEGGSADGFVWPYIR